MLTPDEVEELGRIHTLAQFGELPAATMQRYEELRARSDAAVVPEPTIDIQWMPLQRSRQDAIDDLLGLYDEDEDVPAPVQPPSPFVSVAPPVVAQVELPNTHTSLADMAAFEAQMSGDAYYVASPHTGGFAPSTWYRSH